jgi:hypothetical protein
LAYVLDLLCAHRLGVGLDLFHDRGAIGVAGGVPQCAPKERRIISRGFAPGFGDAALPHGHDWQCPPLRNG